MGGFRQWIKKHFKSKPDTILRKPFEDVNEFYTIHEVLGKGTYGVTYRCTEKSTGRSYACKKISKMRTNDVMMMRSQADHENNIGKEVEIMQLLSGSPNIVDFKSVHEDEKFVHLVMDLCAGGELPVNRRYDESNAARICKQILEAVHACHSVQVMHRDVKPQNLLFSTSDHSNALLKLSDFGVSVFIKEDMRRPDRVGTAPYTAPEVISYKYGKEADIWSAGVILHSILSGILPFRGGKLNLL
ncbi:hypothetical protein K1719_013303 [Acacia pycnantha]|nr:hypothetical protein K1719_013303 [Acacia pycnantha]